MDKKPHRSEIITMTLLFALTLVLTVLKVTRVVSLPWLWVLGPLWLGTYRYRDKGYLRWEISPSVFYYSEMLRCQDEMPTPELRTFCTAKRIIIICVVRYNKQKFIVRKRGVAVDNILNTITAYREERKWSLYDLATHAELKSSTISTWYNDNAIPTIPSLVKICDAFQITLSEFFAKAEGSESVPVALTPQQMQIIEKWSILRPDQQEAVLNLLNTIP